MIDNLTIHMIWVLAGGGFGYYMYKQGLKMGAAVGVRSALIYLSISGKHAEAESFRKFVEDLGEKGFSILNTSEDESDDSNNKED